MVPETFEQNTLSLNFLDSDLEKEFKHSYDKSVRIPLRVGIVISLLSWYSAIPLVFMIIPEQISVLVPLTLVYIGSYFGFLIYSTYNLKFLGYYHILGAISNAWAGLYAIYFCDQFPGGEHLILPVLIFIIFFGSYMVRLRWFAGFIAAATYIISYQVYVLNNSDLSDGQVALYSFVAWMTLVFAVLAGRMAEYNNRVNFTQRRTIKKQSEIILAEKEFLLQEVQHRVKNNLQIIISLIKMELRESDKSIEELEDVQCRVLSMSTAHQWVRQQSNFQKVEIQSFILAVIENIVHLRNIDNSKPKVNAENNPEIDFEKAIPYGLIINEIVLFYWKVNQTMDFEISIKMENNLLQTEFRDQSKNPISDSQKSAELITTLTEQLDGEIQMSFDNGNRVSISFDPF